jgi:hypothetical protein
MLDLEKTQVMNKKINIIFFPNRRQEFIFKIIELNLPKNKPLLFSDIEKALGYEKPLTDLREILYELVEIEVLTEIGKDKYGHMEYNINIKKLCKLIYDSKICDRISEVIEKAKVFNWT